jgi:hypothetical protein
MRYDTVQFELWRWVRGAVAVATVLLGLVTSASAQVTYIGGNILNNFSGATGRSVTFPSATAGCNTTTVATNNSIANGDLQIVTIHFRSNSGTTVTPPYAGWTLKTSIVASGGLTHIYYKVYNSAVDTALQTWNWSAAETGWIRLYAVRGAHTANFHVFSTVDDYSGAGSQFAPGVTTTVAGAHIQSYLGNTGAGGYGGGTGTTAPYAYMTTTATGGAQNFSKCAGTAAATYGPWGMTPAGMPPVPTSTTGITIVACPSGNYPCASVAETLASFSINTGGATASICSAKAITFTAQKVPSGTMTGYTGTMRVTGPTGATWARGVGAGGALVSNPGGLGNHVADYTFILADAGVAVLNMSYPVIADVTATAINQPASIAGTTSTAMNFRSTGTATFTVAGTDGNATLRDNPVAGRAHPMLATYVPAGCGAASAYQGTRSVKAWVTTQGGHPGGASLPSIGGTTLTGAPQAVSLTFNASGQASFNLSASDIGRYVLNLRDDSGSASANINGSTSTLTARPFGMFVLNPAGNAGANTPAGAVFKYAGETFTAQVRPVTYDGADAMNADGTPAAGADLSNNAAVASAASSTLPSLSATVTAPAGGVGALNAVTGWSTAGGVHSADVNFSDVGAITLNASATNYLGTAGLTVTDGGGRTVGRFRPYDLAVAYNTPQFSSPTAACGFSYVGQNFTFGTAPQLTVRARNASGATTGNYTGAWGKLTAGSLTGLSFAAAAGTLNAPTASPLAPTDNANGTYTYTFGLLPTSNFSFNRTAADPFTADIAFRINAISDGEVSVGGVAPVASFGLATAGNGIAFAGGAKSMRYGWIEAPSNAVSQPDVNATLAVPIRIMYRTGGVGVPHTADTCTTLTRSNVVLAFGGGGLNACETAMSTASLGFSGVGATANWTLLAPGALNNGTLTVKFAVDSTVGGDNYCTGQGGAFMAATGASLSHLLDAGGNPTVSVTYGAAGPVMGTNRRRVYVRENY